VWWWMGKMIHRPFEALVIDNFIVYPDLIYKEARKKLHFNVNPEKMTHCKK